MEKEQVEITEEATPLPLELNKAFSSPHGDFSFSILSHIPLINQGLFL